jgi:hypothetical protein
MQAQRQAGFTLTETILGVALITLLTITLLGNYINGIYELEMSRDNFRATQILADRAEAIRLCSWAQVFTNPIVPAAFTNYYTPEDTQSQPVYYGTVAITPVATTASYSNDLRQITIRVSWTTGWLSRAREVTLFVSAYGMQRDTY